MATNASDTGLLRVVLVVLAVVVLAPVVLMVVAMPMMAMAGLWWGSGMMTGGFSPVWGVGMLLFWVVVLGGGGYLLVRAVGRGGDGARADPALEALRMAYARGDLTDDEYEERRARLDADE